MRLPYDAVIFDLDGTLTESEPGITKSVQYSLDALGRTDYDDEMLRSFIGPPLFEAYTRVMGMDDETARKGVVLYRERFAQVGWTENAVYPGIPLLLRSLKAHGAYIALATSKPEMFAGKIAQHFGIAQYIDRIIAASPDNESSDKPELVRRALPDSYRRACMVGDRKYDVEGGQANGIDTIGALYGYGNREELETAGATMIAEDVPSLTALLLGECGAEKGLFISLEGSDGCGKSTQMEPLAGWLRQCGHDLVTTREPGGCPVAERIRDVVLDASATEMTDLTEALLFAASRAQHVHDVIRPAIAAGKTVLCDRYVDSSIAYQGAGRGLGVELVRGLNAPGVEGTMPDLTILFDIDPKAALKRRINASEADRIEATAQAFIQKTYAFYHDLAKREPDRVKTFDADGTPDQVAENLRRFITPLL